ncbi:hypothetical protein [Streptomyces phaeoluteigriseus]|uniref:hypothetical protein n=1 Tax=Streptomyces phaeoluteigriseus TaxID=114686 RepID=UPI0026CF1D95
MSPAHDFGFLHGGWQGGHRRRSDFPAPGSSREPEFPSTGHCRPLFDGAPDIDEIDMPCPGSRGLTPRLFDPSTGQWSPHWPSSDTGRLFPPVVGRHSSDGGEFPGEDTYDGKDARVRFPWYSTQWDGLGGRRRRRPAGSRPFRPTAGTPG